MRTKIIVLFCLLLVIMGCSDSSSANKKLPVVPQFGFSEVQTGRISLDAKTEVARAEAVYFSISPFLTSFDMENSQGLSVDDVYNMTILGKELGVSTSKMEDGSYLFEGILDDGTGEISIIYNPEDNTFSYEQFFVMSLCEYDYEDGDGTNIEGYANYAIYNKGEKIKLNDDGTASGQIYSFHLSQYDSSEDPSYTSTLELVGSSIAEFYRGELSPEKGMGTGVALITTDNEMTNFEDSIYLGGHSEFIPPDSVKITEMRDYLENYVSSYDTSGNENLKLSVDGWILYYQESNSQYFDIQDTLSTDMPITWKDNLTIQF